ncbi:hypothetical protein GCM10023322_73910 [Rugosimonospora acidiphila]|uniref:YCII-related domain-containing protein n=1 Tax=Rugosimonospora acidiphila TaxID=556531 RepID=A0ABP9SNR0_9ACTN
MTTPISDEHMRTMMTTTRGYTSVILKSGPNRHMDGVGAIIWEHGRRNFALRADGLMPIVLPVIDGSDVCGLCVFDLDLDETRKVMDDDPGVRAGVFVYEAHPCRSFPGDALPETPRLPAA